MDPLLLTLFADGTASVMVSIDWKMVISVIGGLTPVIGGLTWLVANQLYKNQIANLTERLDIAEKATQVERDGRANSDLMLTGAERTTTAQKQTISQLEKAARDSDAKYDKLFKSVKQVYDELQKSKSHLADATMKIAALSSDNMRLEADHKKLVADHDILGTDYQIHRMRLHRLERRIKSVQKADGLLWQKRALQNVAEFRPLEERKRAIISVINLKGGVGKTTMTAHLGGALARKGYRVLLVDLDLQGSLTSMMMPRGILGKLDKEGRLLRHFFTAAATDFTTKLSDYTYQLPADTSAAGSINIVPTSDRLGYAEMSLTIGWLMGKGERDTRYLLRKALHLLTDNKPYDIVFLDCPPLLNISCVNALAASDFALVPTLLSRKSAERVPIFCRYVHRENFVTNVNPYLRIMGAVANRTSRAVPGGKEAVVWQELPARVNSSGGGAIRLFDTVLVQTAEIPGSEDQFAHPVPGSKAAEMFDLLAAEVEQELPDDCRISPPVLQQPG